jgi:hypothetical protein
MMSFIFVWHYGVFLSRSESVHFLLSSGYLCIALRDPVITGRGLSCVCPKISNIIYRGLWWLFVLLILVEYVGHHCLNCNFIILVEYRFIRKAHFCRFFLHNCCFALDIYVFYYKTEMYSHSFHTANRYSCYVHSPNTGVTRSYVFTLGISLTVRL